jgi:hypothetical protein
MGVHFEVDSAYIIARREYSFTTTDTAAVALVAIDSICDAATRAVNSATSAGFASSLVVVKIGNFYLASAPGIGALSWVYFLDDHGVLKFTFVRLPRFCRHLI